MDKIIYKTKGVCSKEIEIIIDKGLVKNVIFKAGCGGNLQAVSKLVEGLPVIEVIKKLKGIDCDGKGTSCPDQLSKALEDSLKN